MTDATTTPPAPVPLAKGSVFGLILAVIITAAYVGVRFTMLSPEGGVGAMIASALLVLAGLYVLGDTFRDLRWIAAGAAIILSSKLFLTFDPHETVAYQFFAAMAFFAFARLVHAMVHKSALHTFYAVVASLALGVLSWRAFQFMTPLWVLAFLGIAFEFLKFRDIRPAIRKTFAAQCAAIALMIGGWILLAHFGPELSSRLLTAPHPATTQTGYDYFKATFPLHFGYVSVWLIPFFSFFVISRIYENRLTKKRTNITWLFWFMIWACAWWITFAVTFVDAYRPQLLWALLPLVTSTLLVIMSATRPRYIDIITLLAVLLFAFHISIAAFGWPTSQSPLPYWLVGTPVTSQR